MRSPGPPEVRGQGRRHSPGSALQVVREDARPRPDRPGGRRRPGRVRRDRVRAQLRGGVREEEAAGPRRSGTARGRARPLSGLRLHTEAGRREGPRREGPPRRRGRRGGGGRQAVAGGRSGRPHARIRGHGRRRGAGGQPCGPRRGQDLRRGVPLPPEPRHGPAGRRGRQGGRGDGQQDGRGPRQAQGPGQAPRGRPVAPRPRLRAEGHRRRDEEGHDRRRQVLQDGDDGLRGPLRGHRLARGRQGRDPRRGGVRLRLQGREHEEEEPRGPQGRREARLPREGLPPGRLRRGAARTREVPLRVRRAPRRRKGGHGRVHLAPREARRRRRLRPAAPPRLPLPLHDRRGQGGHRRGRPRQGLPHTGGRDGLRKRAGHPADHGRHGLPRVPRGEEVPRGRQGALRDGPHRHHGPPILCIVCGLEV